MAKLDFLVIGAQKAGTTTLWQLIRGHPQLDLPAAKEVPFFANDRMYSEGIDHYAATYFRRRQQGVLRGSVSPQYMVDSATAGVAEIAARISQALPQVKLVALLRDPIERAISHHRMSVRRGYERRPIVQALREQLSPGALEVGHLPVALSVPPEARRRVYTNSRYVVAGEYGRVLAPYRDHFEPEQFLVLLTSELESDPEGLLERLFAFLGIRRAWRPEDVRARHLVGGDRVRVPPEDLETLRRRLAASVPEAPMGAFDVALEEWNTLAGATRAQLPEALTTRLRHHYAQDAADLERLWGVTVPWRTAPAVPSAAPAPRRTQPEPAPAPAPEIVPEQLASSGDIAGLIAAALEQAAGFSLIRIEPQDVLLLGDGDWPVRRPDLHAIGVRDGSAPAVAALRRAIALADSVSVTTDRRWFVGARMLEAVFERDQLRPRLMAEPSVSRELLAPLAGEDGRPVSSRLHQLLRGRRVAAVSPAALTDLVKRRAATRAASSPEDQARREDLDICLTISLDDYAEVDSVFAALAVQREAYDVVLVVGDVPAKPLCVRLARELDVVALDLGRPLAGFLHPRYNLESGPGLARTRWEIMEYLRECSEPPTEPFHSLEGQLIRDQDDRVFYVERGRMRPVTHPALLGLFDHEPVEVTPEATQGLSLGAPLAAVHERFSGPFVLLNGRKRPLALELPLVELEDFALRELPDDAPLDWHP